VRFLQEECGSAGIHLVLVTGALLTATVLTFELVRYVQLQGRAERAVVTVADYASREATVDCRQVRALVQFVHAEMLGEESSGLLALTAAAGDPDEGSGFVERWTWDPPFALGPGRSSTRLDRCRAELATRRSAALDALAMAAGEDVVMAQLCLTPGAEQLLAPAWLQSVITSAIYRYHVLPIRAATLQEVCA
jgi:hypothetical protein